MADQALYRPPRPAYPTTDPSLRDILRAARTNALTTWPESAYESTVRRERFFGLHAVLLNDPAAIHHVLVEHPENYRRPPVAIRLLRPLTGNGLLLSEGEDWRLQRRTTAPALAPRSMPMLARHIMAVAEETVASLGAGAGGPADLLKAMQYAALNIAARSMFSLETTDFGQRLRGFVLDYGLRYARPRLLDIILPIAIPTYGDLRRRLFQRRWMGFVTQVMRAREQAPAGDTPRDLFDLLLAARDPESGRGFTEAQLRDQVATMILAGHETTGVSMFWTLFLLSQAREEQDRVAEEVRGLDLAGAIASGRIPDLPRTRAVVNETLRLYPAAPVIERVPLHADRAGEIELPKGAIVEIVPWVLHRHRRLWRDPEAFDPARFAPGAPPPPRFAYIPFGAGPRVCVGAQFALTEATLMLAAMVQAFEVELESARPVLPTAIVTTHPDHVPIFRLRPRPGAGARTCQSSTLSAATIPS